MIRTAYGKYIFDLILLGFLIRLSLYGKSLFKKISTQKNACIHFMVSAQGDLRTQKQKFLASLKGNF